jgi:hypothetical protein
MQAAYWWGNLKGSEHLKNLNQSVINELVHRSEAILKLILKVQRHITFIKTNCLHGVNKLLLLVM